MASVVVVIVDEIAFEIGNRVERAAADRAAIDQSKPSLDLIEPGAVDGCNCKWKRGRRVRHALTSAFVSA
jgi:hypothetical protein